MTELQLCREALAACDEAMKRLNGRMPTHERVGNHDPENEGKIAGVLSMLKVVEPALLRCGSPMFNVELIQDPNRYQKSPAYWNALVARVVRARDGIAALTAKTNALAKDQAACRRFVWFGYGFATATVLVWVVIAGVAIRHDVAAGDNDPAAQGAQAQQPPTQNPLEPAPANSFIMGNQPSSSPRVPPDGPPIVVSSGPYRPYRPE